MRKMMKSFGLVVAALSMVGCSYIGDGNFGLERGWNGKYKEKIVKPGADFYIFSTLEEVYGKNLNLPLELSPKDKDAVRLDNLKINVTYRVLPEGAYHYVTNDGDAVYDRNKDVHYIGRDRLSNDLSPSVQQVSVKWASEDMYRDTEKFANEIRLEMQKDINKKYGAKMFEIVDVKIPLVDVAEHIEKKIAQIQITKAEDAQNKAKLEALDSRENVMKKESRLLKDAIDTSGLTAEQYLEFRWQETLSNMNADNISANDSSGSAGNEKVKTGSNSNTQTMIVLNVGKK